MLTTYATHFSCSRSTPVDRHTLAARTAHDAMRTVPNIAAPTVETVLAAGPMTLPAVIATVATMPAKTRLRRTVPRSRPVGNSRMMIAIEPMSGQVSHTLSQADAAAAGQLGWEPYPSKNSIHAATTPTASISQPSGLLRCRDEISAPARARPSALSG